MPPKNSKKVTVKTQTPTYSAVRLSMVVMTAVAMISAGIIGGALLVAVLPKAQVTKTVTPPANRSANAAVLGEVLVRFKAGTTELARVQAVKAALAKPVNVTTVQTVKKRVGLRTVTSTVETVSKQVATYKSLTPVLDPKISLTKLTSTTRQKRGTPSAVQAAASTLSQWYVLRVNQPTADLGQIVTALVGQSVVEKAEPNRYVQAAANPGVASGTAGAAIRLSGAQTAAYATPGDCNLDKTVDSKDLRILINYLVNKGPKPTSLVAADVNRDGAIDLADISALVNFLYSTSTTGYADLTGDGAYNESDVNYLSAYVTGKGPAPVPLSIADYDKDGRVDLTDLTMAINVVFGGASGRTAYGVGDANTDGVVDNRDLDFLIAYLVGSGPAPSPMSLGDMDGDGTVDLTDLTYLMSILYTEVNAVRATAVISSGATSVSGPISSADGGVVQPVVSPTYLLGDSNADSRVTSADIQHLAAYLYQSGPVPSPLGRADLNFDGSLDISDFSILVKLVYDQLKARVALADLNSDGKVDGADLTYLGNYLTKKGPAPDLTKADIDASGNVDLTDFSILGEYVFQTVTPPACAEVRTAGTTTFLNGDVNASGSVTKADLQALGSMVYANAALPSLRERADVNCDAVISPTDVLALNQRLQANVVTALPGDANRDGLVNVQDVAVSATKPTDVNQDGVADMRDTYTLVRLLKQNRVVQTLPDINGDGKVSWSDADVLVQGVFKSGTGSLAATADITADGIVDASDAFSYVDTLRNQQSANSVLAGDANADNLVDCRDVQYLHASYYASGPAPAPASRGDVSGDGTANVADALLLAKRSCPPVGGGSVSSDITIAIIDTGINTTPVDVKATLAKSKETATNSKDDDGNGYVDDVLGYNTLNSAPVNVDCNGHGTTLARMLAAKTGVANQSKVIPVKALDCKGRGAAAALVRGVVFATVRGADIALLPVSGYGTSTLLSDVVKYANAAGVFVVASAGNDAVSTARVFPANVSGVFSVGATTATGGALTSYSNTGAKVSAPGNASGVAVQGTSVSATYVAGTAALALSKNPALTISQLTTKLTPKVTSTNPKTLKLLDAQSAIGQ